MADDLVQMVCEECGSEDVTRDAWAAWDAGTQEWVLGTVFDYAYYHRCQGSTNIEEVPYTPRPKRGQKLE
jgi:hypothetical protein